MDYLPLWTDGLTFREQYDACWIMGNFNEAEQLIVQHPSYSLLPIRFYNNGSWNKKGTYDLHSVGTYADGYELCRTSDLVSTEFDFAYRLWTEAAEMTLREFPEICSLEFEKQLPNGVYPIEFKYSPDAVGKRQEEIMRSLIKAGFSVDEHMKITYSEDGRRKSWHYEGVAGCDYHNLEHLFYKTPHEEPLQIETRKAVSFSYEECSQYYTTFNEKMLELGNKRKKYLMNELKSKDLFLAARAGDYEKMFKLVSADCSLNSIGSSGETAFAMLAEKLFDSAELTSNLTKILEQAVSLGANPAIKGVDSATDSPLQSAVVGNNVEYVRWLLEQKVNPCMYMFLDDLSEEGVTLQDFARRVDFERELDEEGHDSSRMLEIINILSRASQ